MTMIRDPLKLVMTVELLIETQSYLSTMIQWQMTLTKNKAQLDDHMMRKYQANQYQDGHITRRFGTLPTSYTTHLNILTWTIIQHLYIVPCHTFKGLSYHTSNQGCRQLPVTSNYYASEKNITSIGNQCGNFFFSHKHGDIICNGVLEFPHNYCKFKYIVYFIQIQTIFEATHYCDTLVALEALSCVPTSTAQYYFYISTTLVS